MNTLFLKSYLAYWSRAAIYQQYTAYTKFTQIANNRLRLIRIAVTQGDRAVTVTVEAYTQLQMYQLMQSEALLKLTNAKLELSNYLWFENYSVINCLITIYLIIWILLLLSLIKVQES